jgi:hypothetical protein
MTTFVVRIVAAGALLLAVAATVPLAAQKTKPSPRFVDNGNGTVTDNQTGLMWEKKTTANVADSYVWSSSTAAQDGPLFFDFLAKLRCINSADGSCGLAGHYDWRLPNISELQSILDCSHANCLDPIFGPTAQFYWSSTTDLNHGLNAWVVYFGNGSLMTVAKNLPHAVRAVRGGQ